MKEEEVNLKDLQRENEELTEERDELKAEVDDLKDSINDAYNLLHELLNDKLHFSDMESKAQEALDILNDANK